MRCPTCARPTRSRPPASSSATARSPSPASTPTAVGRSIRTEVVEGDFPAALAAGEVAVQRTTMEDEDWSLGQELEVAGSSGAATLTIGAVIDSPAFGVPFVVSQDVLDALFPPDEQRVTTVFVTAADGADVAALRDELDDGGPAVRRGLRDGQRGVRLRPGRTGGPGAGHPLRAAGAVGGHRGARHREHARAVRDRAHPRDRAAPRGRPGPAPAGHHDHPGVGAHRRVRHDRRAGPGRRARRDPADGVRGRGAADARGAVGEPRC